MYALRVLKRSGTSALDMTRIYCSLIRSILEYGAPAYANLPEHLSHELEKVQKRALAIIYPDCSYEDALSLAKLTKLRDRRHELCVSFMRSLDKENPLYCIAKNRTLSADHHYNLRNTPNIQPVLCNTNRLKNFVSVKYVHFLS